MDQNQNPPNMLDALLGEGATENIFGFASTGIFNNGSATYTNGTLKQTGIHVTSIVPPEQGWPVAYYCPLCRETTFVMSPWAVKPTVDGKEFDGYHKIKDMCASEEHGFRHNMEMGMKCYNAPINLRPDK